MKIRLVKIQKDFEFPFPGDPENCPSALFYKVGLGESEEPFTMVVGFTSREVYSRNRRRIHVGIEQGSSFRPVVEFVGTDDYLRTGDCVHAIKRANSNEWVPTTESVSMEYLAHRIVIFERYIPKGGNDHWGVLVNEGQIDDMLRVALIRASHKGLKTTP